MEVKHDILMDIELTLIYEKEWLKEQEIIKKRALELKNKELNKQKKLSLTIKKPSNKY